MQEDQFLGYVSHYHDARPKGGKGWLFWTSLVIHAAVLVAIVVTPLYQVSDLPQFETMSAFMVTPPTPPPPPPPPPPAAPPRSSSSSRGGQKPRLSPRSDFIAPVVIPSDIPVEDFGPVDFGVPGGVAGGVPGGVVGGIVGGISESAPPPPAAPQEPVRVDFRQQEARPIHRVDPVYPDLAAQAHVQGVVIVEVLVDEQGVPAQTKILRSVPLLDAAAIDAVRQWRWNPYESGGRAVPFLVTVTVNFQLMTS